MLQTVRSRSPIALVLVLAAMAMLLGAATASAHSSNAGGASYEEPAVTGIKCGTGDAGSCPQGHVLRPSSEGLGGTRAVTFLGGKGRRDDRTARPTERSPHRVIVAVPASARSGPLKVATSAATLTGPRLRVLSAKRALTPATPAAPAADGGVFPVQGEHRYGTETNRFGGGRGHEGQDVFADCGTPLVAALPGVVTFNRFQDRAGNYVVIKADDGTGQAYMHLAAPATVEQGQRVAAGQPIGQVGDTGRASGCHLHFELWTAPGWYEGGSPVDPLPALQRWDAAG
jgi:murein DD-endopeptidase MepM/ murein hydrolase activator NlpD